GDEVRDRDHVDAGQLWRGGHDQGQSAADRQQGVCRVAVQPVRAAEELLDVQAAGRVEDLVVRHGELRLYAGGVVGVHAGVPGQRRPDGYRDREDHRRGEADDLGDAVAVVDPAGFDDQVLRVCRAGALRPAGVSADVLEQGVEVDRVGEA